MRDVDSDALRRIARVLGVGNPVTAVEQVSFDDSNLQQTLEVSRLVPGYGLGDGFFTMAIGQLHVVTGVLGTIADLYATAEGSSSLAGAPLGLRSEYRIWLMDIQTQRTIPAGGDSIDSINAGYRLALANTELNDWVCLITQNFGGAISSGAAPQVGYTPGWDGASAVASPAVCRHVPRELPPGSSLRFRSSSTIAGAGTTATVLYYLWVGPRGLKPPGVA